MDDAYEVEVKTVLARPTMVVTATTTWAEFPTLWLTLLDDVWVCLREQGVTSGFRNVMVYHDDRPRVEVGVVRGPQSAEVTGRVVDSALPAGLAAFTVHRGPFTGVGAAHGAVERWCAANGHSVAWPRYEIYGPHNDDPAQLWTEIYHIISA